MRSTGLTPTRAFESSWSPVGAVVLRRSRSGRWRKRSLVTRPGSGDRPPHHDEGGLVTLRIYSCTKPVIGAINGPAVGVGATMTLPMDMRLAE